MKFEESIRKIVTGVVLVLLAISIWGAYASINDLISTWINYKYAPAYRALLNLSIIILSIYVLRLLISKR